MQDGTDSNKPIEHQTLPKGRAQQCGLAGSTLDPHDNCRNARRIQALTRLVGIIAPIERPQANPVNHTPGLLALSDLGLQAHR